MFKEDAKYLRCISCGKDLKPTSFKEAKGEIIEGKLACKCGESWPIINAIPRILPADLMASVVVPAYPQFFRAHKFPYGKAVAAGLKAKTAESFGFEWLAHPHVLEEFEKDWDRHFNPFIKRQDIKGKVVADFGCGMAKHGHFIGKYGAKKYIGTDLSLAVEAAYKNTKQYKPLIVQADIYNLPLKGENIDIYYSIGVLHHLPDPRKGFESIAGLMKKGARILIWVYGKQKNFRALYVYNPVRVVTTRIPRKVLYKLCHVPAAALHTLNLAQEGLGKIGLESFAKKLPFYYYKNYPYKFKVSDSFDVFGTPKQVYYEISEIKEWLRKARLKGQALPDAIQGIKGYGVR